MRVTYTGQRPRRPSPSGPATVSQTARDPGRHFTNRLPAYFTGQHRVFTIANSTRATSNTSTLTTRPSRTDQPTRYCTAAARRCISIAAATNGTNSGHQLPVHPRRPLAPRVQRAGHGYHQRRPSGNFRYNRPEPEHGGHGRGLRRLRPGELVPGDPERRRPGDDPVVPPAGGSSGIDPQ